MSFPVLLQTFFTDRLMRQRGASPHTVASYRDTFRLLLRFMSTRAGKLPTDLQLEDLSATCIGEFLDDLESTRGIGASTRNARLAAIRSFFRFVALREPFQVLLCQQVLAMPNKRHERRLVSFLEREEIAAHIAAPDLSTRLGRRDRALFLLAIQTGLRVSELIGLRCRDVTLGTGAHVRCLGKGRKERCVPLRQDVTSVLQEWIAERAVPPDDPVFVTIRSGFMSRDAVERSLNKHIESARVLCPSLRKKTVTPHTLRHTAAMELLRSGVDLAVIALWLGHESVKTTQMYLHADLKLKERALARTSPSPTTPARYRPGDKLMAFLEGL